MSIDYGTRNVGVAVSDELRLTVRPLATIRRRRQSRNELMAQLLQLVDQYQAGLLVVGLPLRIDGTSGDAALRVQNFVAELRKVIAVPIVTQDEKLTSHEADLMMRELGFDAGKRKERSDEFAAAIILKEYVDSHPAVSSPES